MDNETERLIQQALDGDLSPDEEVRLDRVLAEDPQARAALAEYRGLAGALGRMPQAVPPPNFTANVMAALPAPVPVRARVGRVRRFWKSLPSVSSLRLAYAVAAVAVLVTAVVMTVNRPFAPAGAEGTMSSRTSGQPVELGASSGRVAATVAGDAVRLDVRVADVDGGTLQVAWDADAFRFLRADFPNEVPTTQSAQAGLFEGVFAGDAAFRIELRPIGGEARSVELRLLADDGSVHRTSVPLPGR